MNINVRNTTGFRLALVCLSAVYLYSLPAASFAASGVDAADDYADSVYSWGVWELGLEPASGAQPPALTALNDRSRNLQFRPNDNAAFTTKSIPLGSPAPTLPPSLPVPIVGADGSGPILPGMVPNPPNLR